MSSPSDVARPGSGSSGAFQANQQHLYPHRLLCALMFAATRFRFRPWKNWQIRWFVERYGVDLDEAMESGPGAYPHFNAFFTRALRPGARPVDRADDALVAPCDGAVSQVGAIENGTLMQAKGRHYSIESLLGGSPELGAEFAGGRFVTIYLAPRDYHRIHMPVDGRLREMIHVPGRFFSVNPNTTTHIEGLFARNERVVSIFDTALGAMAVVLVGALFVGGIEQVWTGAVTPPRRRRIGRWRYDAGHQPAVSLDQGAEMGRFNMGSTVVLALADPAVEWVEGLGPGSVVRMGERLSRPLTG